MRLKKIYGVQFSQATDASQGGHGWKVISFTFRTLLTHCRGRSWLERYFIHVPNVTDASQGPVLCRPTNNIRHIFKAQWIFPEGSWRSCTHDEKKHKSLLFWHLKQKRGRKSWLCFSLWSNSRLPRSLFLFQFHKGSIKTPIDRQWPRIFV